MPKDDEVQINKIIKGPSLLLEIDGDVLKVNVNMPADTDTQKMGIMLYRLNKGEFAETILQAIVRFCQLNNKMATASSIIDEFTSLWKKNRPAIRPTQVFKD